MITSFSFAVLGAIVASFVGVLSERLFTGQAWAKSRSRCNSCALALTPRDLIPVISWLIHRGRCRMCGAKVPFGYVVFELLLAALYVLSYLILGISFALFALLALLAVLLFIGIYDIRHTLVPPQASSLLAALALLFAWLTAPSLSSFGLSLLIAGGIALSFLALHVFSKGRAMGLGDAPVSFSLALVAAPYALYGVLFSFWIGALWGIVVLFVRRGGPRMGIEVPFVPFLAIGFLLAYFTQWNFLGL